MMSKCQWRNNTLLKQNIASYLSRSFKKSQWVAGGVYLFKNDSIHFSQMMHPRACYKLLLEKRGILYNLSPAADHWGEVREVRCGTRQLLPLRPRLHFQRAGNKRCEEDWQILRRQPPSVGDFCHAVEFIFTKPSCDFISVHPQSAFPCCSVGRCCRRGISS